MFVATTIANEMNFILEFTLYPLHTLFLSASELYLSGWCS